MSRSSKVKSTIDSVSLFGVNRGQYGERYHDHYLEQYKLYVEMADRVSSRRLVANTFFLSINTAVMAATTVLMKDGLAIMQWMLFPIGILELFCLCWWLIIKSYRQLNGSKYTIIGMLEESLPAKPYSYEWALLSQSNNSKSYITLTHIESWLPIGFALVYLVVILLHRKIFFPCLVI